MMEPLVLPYSDRLAMPGFWLQPLDSMASRELAWKLPAAPSRPGRACDQSAVGRWLGNRADRSMRHKSRHRRALALATRPAERESSACLDGGTKTADHLLYLSLVPAQLGLALSFVYEILLYEILLSAIPPAVISSAPILPVRFFPARPAPDRRRVSAGARVAALPRRVGHGVLLLLPPQRSSSSA